MSLPFPTLNATEAAQLISHGDTVAFGGFTPAGAPKEIPTALAALAQSEHAAGRAFHKHYPMSLIAALEDRN